MNDKWINEISLLGTGLERRWAGHVGVVVEQVVNLGLSLFLNSAILCPWSSDQFLPSWRENGPTWREEEREKWLEDARQALRARIKHGIRTSHPGCRGSLWAGV